MADPSNMADDSNVQAEVPIVQTMRKTLDNENDGEQNPENQSIVTDVIQNQSQSNNDNDDRKKTRIPVSRFRQTVEKVTANRRGSRDKDEPHGIRGSLIPKPSRSAPAKPERKSIPKLILKETLAIQSITRETRKQETTEPEDEFDKLYEEVAHSPVNIDISLLDPKVEDPEKVENIFKEIIHDYDENNVKPIDVETIKRSKIPFLKRQSLQEDRNSKIIAARDKVRLRHNSTKSNPDTNDDEVKNDHNSKEVIVKNNEYGSKDNELIVKHMKTVITSRANQEDDNIKVISTTTVTDVNTIESSDKIEPIKGHIIVENIQKEFVKVGVPVYESYVVEHTEKIGEKTVEVKNILSYTTNNNESEIVNTNNDIEKIDHKTRNVTEITKIDDGNKPTPEHTKSSIDLNENSFDGLKLEATHAEHALTNNTDMRERDEIYDSLLREKDSRLLSHESINKDAFEIDSGNKLPKKESVLSKIAMFERQEPIKNKIPKKDLSLPKLTTSSLTIEKVHVHTPLIVDEIYKFDATTGLVNNDNEVDVIKNGDEDVSEIVKADMVIIESPQLIRYDNENNTTIRTTSVTDERAAVKEEVLTPVLRKYDRQLEEDSNKNNEAVNDFNKVKLTAIPKFIPVREVLKRFESLSGQNQYKKPVHIPKRSISEMRSIPKIDSTQNALDIMFVNHEKPVSEILKDIHTAEIKEEDKKENIFKLSNESIGIETKTNNNSYKNDLNYDANHDENVETKASGKIDRNKFKIYDFNEEFKKPELDYTTLDSGDDKFKSLEFIQDYVKAKDDMRRTKSVAELDLGDAVKGKVNKIISRINSFDFLEEKNQSKVKDLPRKRSVSEKIALFERKLTPAKENIPPPTKDKDVLPQDVTLEVQAKVEELAGAKKYGSVEVPSIELANGVLMPVLAVGTALLDPRLVYHVICAAIDLGYRAIDCAFIYGNEKEVGQAIRHKIGDGTVKRKDLFIISKLWSTFHRTDLVKKACEDSLEAMGLEYFDLYLIHNPMSFKEGGSPFPRIATVLQYSTHEYLDAWYGMEALGAKARALGLSNFNSQQIRRIMDRAKVKPVVNQVECHPYLTQQKLDNFCSERNVTLSCFGVLGSKGTPSELKNSVEAVIDDPLVQVMASGLGVTPAQLLIRYQIQNGHSVVVKASSAARLWDNLQSLTFKLTEVQVEALHALNRNKRTFAFKGMGDTHKNYPFNEPF